MVLMCRRLLPEAKRDIYLQGASSFKLPKKHVPVRLYCSSHNPGAAELSEELNRTWPGLLQVVDVQSQRDLSTCDHMLIYLNALTWTHDPETFAADIRQAMREGLHLQPCHEFPSVVDTGSARHALEFKQIMDATPADLKKGPTNIYSQIAIALKGGELREPGMANLAARLAVRVPRKAIEVLPPNSGNMEPTPQSSVAGLIKSTSQEVAARLFRSASQDKVAGLFKTTSQADVNLGVERPLSCRRSTSSSRRPDMSPAVDNTAAGAVRPGDEEASAAGAIPVDCAVVESSV